MGKYDFYLGAVLFFDWFDEDQAWSKTQGAICDFKSKPKTN
jgi:hypothetical protein